MAREDNSLDQVDPTSLGEGEERANEKERDLRERSSTFSLEFLAIRASVSGET